MSVRLTTLTKGEGNDTAQCRLSAPLTMHLSRAAREVEGGPHMDDMGRNHLMTISPMSWLRMRSARLQTAAGELEAETIEIRRRTSDA